RLKRILGALGRCFDLSGSLEFTLEVSPGSAAGDFLRDVRAVGANRLSIGAQSFNDLELRTVGRLHTAGETRELVLQARRAAFQNINLDLVAGLPHQTEATWRESLSTALDLRPQHLSVYLFEIDEKSRLGREVLNGGTRYGAAAVPGEEFMGAAYELARDLLTQAGYVQYEVSNFALPGCSSRHNRKYWRLEPYLGFGAGAHSFYKDQRWANEEIVEAYEAKLSRRELPIAEVRDLSPKEQLEEFFFLGLRQNDGIDLSLARDRWGRDQTAEPEARVAALVADGWVERVADRVRLAERAFLVSNEIFEHFLT
ncbi:MAG: coproporphyrinogen III oxidase, partial [Acidobacteria bacterium]